MPTVDYEVTYIVEPTLEEEKVDEVIEQIKGELANVGGAPGEIEKLGKRRLAYEINDVREGSYVVMKFKGDAAQAKELERKLRLHDSVMRALLLRVDK